MALTAARAEPPPDAPSAAPTPPDATPVPGSSVDAPPTAPLRPPAATPPFASRAATGPGFTDRNHLETDGEIEPSYRLHLVIADAGAILLAATGSKPGLIAGTSIYLLDGAVIHSAHGHDGRVFASVLLRAGLPVLGALALSAQARNNRDAHCRPDPSYCEDDEEGFGAALLGFGLGILGAIVIDDAVIARPARVRRQSASWAPRIAASPGQLALGVTGRF